MDAPSDHEPALRSIARTLIEAGTLPDRPPDQLWGGPGLDATCTLCSKPICRDETEFEIEFRDGGLPSRGSTYRLHSYCFAAWDAERSRRAARAGSKNGHDGAAVDRLTDAAADGTVCGRERADAS